MTSDLSTVVDHDGFRRGLGFDGLLLLETRFVLHQSTCNKKVPGRIKNGAPEQDCSS
jgi:hypothetical protein